ncbi:MAG: PilT/PilU family type 4a pilus ATPase [Candidatus Andersenbacteria bacterium]|nr:PilT/PilU family type 4a pilus ATPase [Candidatus Andersenbacteria bacterium]
MRTIDDLLREAQEAGASDIHVTPGRPPFFRINGQLQPVGSEQITEAENKEVMATLLAANKDAESDLAENRQTDFSYELKGVARFRVNVFYHVGQLSASLRLIPASTRTVEDLHLPPQILYFAELKQGFVLVVGPAGHGKSTTLAALIDYINQNRREHIITIEDPIEYIFQDKQSIVDQREVGHDASSFATAIRSTLRQDPNVIMIGEIRDLESMQTAITSAETGHLVFATLHTNDSAQTIERIVDSFPSDQQRQVRAQLSGSLSGIVSQRLLPWTAGGRIPAIEIMIATTAVRNTIREGNFHQILGIIQTSSDVGMQTLDASLQALVDAGAVKLEDARPYFTMTKSLSR